VFLTRKYIKIIFFLFLKKLFLTSAHQNDLKTQKKNNLKQKNKIKIQIFLKNTFKTQKQTETMLLAFH